MKFNKNNFHFPTLFCFWVTMFFYVQVQATDGWEWIKKNDFVAAKSAFETALQVNPKDANALKGLIFLAEISDDNDSYQKYITQLIEINWDTHEFLLFGHIAALQPEQILAASLAPRAKVAATMAVADSLFYHRKKSESEAVLRQVIGNYDWKVIGPFKNVSGGGFITPYEVETDPFSPEKLYKNKANTEVKWLERRLRQPDGVVNFSLLPQPNYYEEMGVYYANTFLQVPDNQRVQFRINRKTPMKIWLDDDLIFENEDNLPSNWDAEIVTLDLTKGTHRLLVKVANYFGDEPNSSTLSLDYYENERFFDTDFAFLVGYQSENEFDFAIRLTDENGKFISNIKSSFSGSYDSKKYNLILESKTEITYFKSLFETNVEDWATAYFLSKAYLRFDYSEDGEAYFAALQQRNPESVFLKYLLAKFYTTNGKSERGEALISGLDEAKIPIFKMIYKDFQKIDYENDEENYWAALEKMLAISPTNLEIVRLMIAFYDNKGMTEEKKKFILDFVERYPKYRVLFEYDLKEDSYKPTSYKPMTERERVWGFKHTLKQLKTTYNRYDYYDVIRYLRDEPKEKEGKILELYDEMIAMEPYYLPHWTDKAEYLFERGKLDETLVVLNQVIEQTPYLSKVYETIGDVYFEKKDKNKALEFYKIAQKIDTDSYGYGGEVDYKIEKIEEKEKYKDLFKTSSFEDVLADEGWKAKYEKEESVILLYTAQAELSEDNRLDIRQKILIKILTEAGAKFWTEADFGIFGYINYVRIIKPNGQQITPENSGSLVVFKNLEAGDLIQLESFYDMNMTFELEDAFFFTVPLNYEAIIYKSEVELMVEAGKKLQFRCNRINCSYEKRTEKGKDIYTWKNENIAKMEQEEAVLDEFDQFAWLMMSSLSDWSEVVRWYQKKTYRRLEANYEIQKIVEGLVTPNMTDEEKVVAIYNYITKEINYSFVPFLQTSFVPKTPGATCSAKIGDCKDVSSLMISMLRLVGIEAYYVLVKTRNFTALEPVPSLWFDHVITGYYLNGSLYFADLTTDFYPHYVLHEGDSEAWALLIKDGSNQLFKLPNDQLNPEKSLLKIEIRAKLGEDRNLTLAVKTEAKGVMSGHLREGLHLRSDDERRKFISQYFGQSVFENLKIVNYHFGELEEITHPLESNFEFEVQKFLDKISRFYVFEIPFMKAAARTAELLPDRRYNNLDLHQIMDIYPNEQTVYIEIPDGYRVSEIPESVVLSNPFFDYELKYEATSEGLKVYRKVNFKNRLVKVEDFQTFKACFSQMVEADNLKLAMEK